MKNRKEFHKLSKPRTRILRNVSFGYNNKSWEIFNYRILRIFLLLNFLYLILFSFPASTFEISYISSIYFVYFIFTRSNFPEMDREAQSGNQKTLQCLRSVHLPRLVPCQQIVKLTFSNCVVIGKQESWERPGRGGFIVECIHCRKRVMRRRIVWLRR